jgi:hypothetical protein
VTGALEWLNASCARRASPGLSSTNKISMLYLQPRPPLCL